MPLVSLENDMKAVPFWINGKPHVPTNPTLFPIISSATSKPVHSALSASIADANLACETAASSFTTWRRTTPAHRRKILLKAADIYASRINEIAAFQVTETCCSPQFAQMTTAQAVEYIQEIAASTIEIRGTICQRHTNAQDGTGEDGLTLVITAPVGPVLIIPPWNGAIILATRALSMALAAGCSIVLKSSEKCPLTHHSLVLAFEEAGVPPGVISTIQVRREDAPVVTEAIIANSAIRKIDFIGSQAVGRVVAGVCGKYLKPLLLELGGKGPSIVCDDADLERAAKLCALGATLHHGQLCFSTERILVQRSISGKFLPMLTAAFAHLPPPLVGVAVDDTSLSHAQILLQEAESQGAIFLAGSASLSSPTSLPATLLSNVSESSRLWDEESFGPISYVVLFDTDEEAIALANKSAYGLSAAVHTGSWERAYNIARDLEFGQVQVNGMTVGDAPSQPIRGVKGSGWGQSNAIWGVREFVVEKLVNLGPGKVEGPGMFGI